MDELDFKGGLVGDFKRSPSVNGNQEQEQQESLKVEEKEEGRPFISKSPSNSSFGFDNTFRVLEKQVSTSDEGLPDNHQPAIVTTLELELGAVARLQQFNFYSTPKSSGAGQRSSRSTTISPKVNPEDCDKYLEFLNQFIRKSRQRVSDKKASADCDTTATNVSITVAGDDGDDEPGLVEFGEYPELVYCIAKDKSGRYRLQNKDRIKSPQRTQNEGKHSSLDFLRFKSSSWGGNMKWMDLRIHTFIKSTIFIFDKQGRLS